MPERIPQSVAKRVVFRAIGSSDHITPNASATIAITISKNGGAFGNPAAGATNATAITSGFYYFDLGTGDTGTAGPLAWRGAGTGVDDVGDVFEVVNATNAGFSALPNVAAGSNGGVPLVGSQVPNANAGATGGLPLSVDTSGRVDVLKINGTSQTARDIGASVLLSAGTGTGQLDFTSGVVKANVTQFGGSNGTFASGIPSVNASQFGGAAVTATTSVTIPASSTLATTTGAVGSVTGNVGGNVTGSVGSVVGAVGSVTGNVGGNLSGSVGSIATGGIVAASFAADAIDAVALAATAVNEIRDAVFAKVMTELIGDPGATPTFADAIMLQHMALRNKRETDSSGGTDKLYNSAGTAILSAAVSDTGTVFTKAKYA